MCGKPLPMRAFGYDLLCSSTYTVTIYVFTMCCVGVLSCKVSDDNFGPVKGVTDPWVRDWISV